MADRASVRKTLIDIMEADTGESYAHVEESQKLREDLGLDSVDVVSIVSQIERTMRIRLSQEELLKLSTVGDVLDLLVAKVSAASASKAA